LFDYLLCRNIFMNAGKDSSPSPESSEIEKPSGAEQAEANIPLKPFEQPAEKETTPERLAAEIRGIDVGLSALVFVLAFLLAAFTVRNSDFWLHLASGRLYASGHFSFGADPFSYTNANAYYVNHSWLYDLLLYVVASLFGGPESVVGGAGIVIAKSLLIVSVAWVMFNTRRLGLSLWAPAFCTAFALVAMSLRLLLQPTLISLLFLALTVSILQRPQPEDAGPARARSWLASYWLLPPLFVLWVNLDSWFVLGPFTVLLFLVGQSLQRVFAPVRTGPDAQEPGQLRKLLLVLLVGVVACLINPHHYHAFALPAQLGLTGEIDALERDRILRRLFDSPFQEDYFQAGGAFFNVAGLSYFPLLLFGLVSFVLSIWGGFRWWRLLVWLGFAILSGYQARNVPFFAVVAGPIMALNLQDFAVRRFGRAPRLEPRWKAWSLGGRIVTGLALVVLMLATWPGWLHGRPTDTVHSHRVAFDVYVEPSLKQAALQVKEWRANGLLRPEDNAFNDLPEFTNYCAWFCTDPQGLPLEKTFFDYRFGAFPASVATSYIDIRSAFRGRSDKDDRRVNWQEIFRKSHINHLVLYRMADQEAFSVWASLLADWQQWRLVYLDGRTMMFYWNDPRGKKSDVNTGLPRYDPNLLAFGPKAERASAEGPLKPLQVADLWDRYLHAATPQPLAADFCESTQLYFRVISNRWTAPFLIAKEVGGWASAVGSTGVVPGAATVEGPAALALVSVPTIAALRGNTFAMNLLIQGLDPGPPAAPILGVRAGWRAISENPESSSAYSALAQSYKVLSQLQEDQWTGHRGAQPALPRQQLREVQVTALLERGLKVRPNDLEAHMQLRQIYLQHQYLDLALEHTRAAYDILAAIDPAGSAKDREQHKEQMDGFQKELDKLDTEVTRRRNEFELSAANQPLYSKAQMALRKGLAKRALDMLLEADQSQVTPREIPILIDVLIASGRLEDAHELMGESLKSALGAEYEWLNVLDEAGLGNHATAGAYLDEMITRREEANVQGMLVLTQRQLIGQGLPQMFMGVNQLFSSIRQIADYRVIRGMIALDEGDTATAVKSFRRALNAGGQEGIEFESKPIAVRYLELIKQAGGDQ
jgi:tetratricopeptide (TPR) repeat protein